MSNWILYDEIVDLVRNHHHEAFSGLITGVSDDKCSFQIGFDRGEIVLLTYRVKKGMQALPLIAQIERAKITEHPTTDIQEAGNSTIDTSIVLSQLTAATLDDTTSVTTDISDISKPRAKRQNIASKPLDRRMKESIEAAAIHHFGPIGAMVCEEHLGASGGDVRAVMLAIAQEVGADQADTQAFFKTATEA